MRRTIGVTRRAVMKMACWFIVARKGEASGRPFSTGSSKKGSQEDHVQKNEIAATNDGKREAAWKSSALRHVMIPMRDGVRLAAEVYVPSEDGATPAMGRFPVLLMRTPYGRERIWSWPVTAATARMLTPEIANRHGYVIVYQDVRGTFDSEGVFEPMHNEGMDGFDTVAWLRDQAWSDGRIATCGPSYMGAVQMLLAAEQPLGLMAAFSQTAATDMFKNGWVFLDGVFSGVSAEWTSLQVDTAVARLSDGKWQEALKADYAALGITDPMNVAPETSDRIVKTLPLRERPIVRNAPWWREWLSNWNNPSHFQNSEMSDRFERIGVPILHLGGWYDTFLRNTYEHYKNTAARASDPKVRAEQRLVIGPWSHASDDGCAPNADVDAREMQIAWMDQWFKGKKSTFFESPVVLYVMGENRWRAEESWPLTGTQRTRFYLHSKGGANTAEGNGTLSTSPPDKEQPDRFVYDPRNPAPTLGGSDSRAALQNDAETRSDILVYSTPQLADDVEVTGEVTATLYAASSARDTDWWVKLIDVAPDGKASILCHGVIRARYRISRTDPCPLTPGKIDEYAINMWATSNVFKKGHRIRIEVTSSNFPYADRNPNTFVDLATATENDFVVATQTVFHETRYPSYVELPLIPRSRARKWIETPFPYATDPSVTR